jgi:hypothetical protein
VAAEDDGTARAAQLDGLKPSSRRRSSGKKGAVPFDQSRRTGALPLVTFWTTDPRVGISAAIWVNTTGSSRLSSVLAGFGIHPAPVELALGGWIRSHRVPRSGGRAASLKRSPSFERRST